MIKLSRVGEVSEDPCSSYYSEKNLFPGLQSLKISGVKGKHSVGMKSLRMFVKREPTSTFQPCYVLIILSPSQEEEKTRLKHVPNYGQGALACRMHAAPWACL